MTHQKKQNKAAEIHDARNVAEVESRRRGANVVAHESSSRVQGEPKGKAVRSRRARKSDESEESIASSANSDTLEANPDADAVDPALAAQTRIEGGEALTAPDETAPSSSSLAAGGDASSSTPAGSVGSTANTSMPSMGESSMFAKLAPFLVHGLDWAASGGGWSTVAAQPIAAAVGPANTFVTGIFVAGPALPGNGLTVQAYDAKGIKIGSEVKLAADGSFRIDLGVAYSGKILLKISDSTPTEADYMDERQRSGVSLDTFGIRAIDVVHPSTSNVINISPVTELAVREAGVNGTNIASVDVAIIQAVNHSIPQLLGLSSTKSITQLVPIATINVDGTANTAVNQYGYLLAALSGAESTLGDAKSVLTKLAELFTDTTTGASLSSQQGSNGVNIQNLLLNGFGAIDSSFKSGIIQENLPTILIDNGVSSTNTNTNEAPTGSVTISGTPTQGQTLTAANTLADADGLGTVAYQWKANGVNI
ncbi:hypothetical protein, partial [Polaromonas sp. YR568]|uniref:hypothetical protein n=1 Tax=Polaromonas sp. YR568 TaxID=1855301 RepID=UPI0031379996